MHRAADAVVDPDHVTGPLRGVVPGCADQRVDHEIDRDHVHDQMLVADDTSNGAPTYLRHYTCRMIKYQTCTWRVRDITHRINVDNVPTLRWATRATGSRTS